MIRPIKTAEIPLLADFLYHAIFVPQGLEAPAREILEQPDLQIYIEDFGQKTGDLAYVAEKGRQIVGAVWVRFIKDYGYLNDQTPSLSISLLPDYRGQGIGGQLMQTILSALKREGYQQVSLSVSKDNPAFRFYQRLGFQLIKERETDYLMVYDLDKN